MKIYYGYQYLNIYTLGKGREDIKHKVYQGDFIHEFGNSYKHTFKGSLKRHLSIEKYLYRFNHWLLDYDSYGWYKIFRVLLTILYGLNCDFPKLDILRYLVFQYKTKRLY